MDFLAGYVQSQKQQLTATGVRVYMWLFFHLIELLMILAVYYVFCRAFLIVECLISIAYLPDSVYQVPQWPRYFPHISWYDSINGGWSGIRLRDVILREILVYNDYQQLFEYTLNFLCIISPYHKFIRCIGQSGALILQDSCNGSLLFAIIFNNIGLIGRICTETKHIYPSCYTAASNSHLVQAPVTFSNLFCVLCCRFVLLIRIWCIWNAFWANISEWHLHSPKLTFKAKQPYNNTSNKIILYV